MWGWLQMGKNRVVAIALRSFAEYGNEPLDILQQHGYTLIKNDKIDNLSEDALSDLLKDVNGVIAGVERYSKTILRGAKQLKVISRVGIGLDNIDLEYATKTGIKVVNTPDAPSWPVTEYTITMILMLLKKLHVYDQRLRQGIWSPIESYMLRDKVVGIVGLGRIGQNVGVSCAAFGCLVVGYDPYIDAEVVDEHIEIKKTLEDVLKVADIITLHIPLTKDNYHLISTRELEIMKNGSFLINTSRGGVVDEDALYLALKNGHLAGAALDVFEKEPYDGPLFEIENVIVTPHTAAMAKEARIAMEIEAVENLVTELKK